MPSKSPRAAVDAALERLRRTAACVTDRPVISGGHRPSSQPLRFAFAPVRKAVPLRRRDGVRSLLLEMALEYTIEETDDTRGAFVMRTTAYWYRVLDRQEQEILAYHWHPIGPSPVAFPHVHLSSRIRPIDIGVDTGLIALAEMHLPTGPVTLEDIVRLLITEFSVAPRRANWADILAEGS